MGLVHVLRRLFNFSSLDRIKRAIDGLSDEEWNELLEYMEGGFSDTETADLDPDFEGGGWY